MQDQAQEWAAWFRYAIPYFGRVAKVPGYKWYWITDDGIVTSVKDGFRALRQECHYRTGHMRVCFWTAHRERKRHKVHQLVMRAFIGPCPEGLYVLHADDNPKNNGLGNLRYGSEAENSRQREARKRVLKVALERYSLDGEPPLGFDSWGDWDLWVEQEFPRESEEMKRVAYWRSRV